MGGFGKLSVQGTPLVLVVMQAYDLVLFYVLYSVCWPPVGPQEIQT